MCILSMVCIVVRVCDYLALLFMFSVVRLGLTVAWKGLYYTNIKEHGKIIFQYIAC